MRRTAVLFGLCELLRGVAVALQPVVPTGTGRVLSALGIPPNKRGLVALVDAPTRAVLLPRRLRRHDSVLRGYFTGSASEDTSQPPTSAPFLRGGREGGEEAQGTDPQRRRGEAALLPTEQIPNTSETKTSDAQEGEWQEDQQEQQEEEEDEKAPQRALLLERRRSVEVEEEHKKSTGVRSGPEPAGQTARTRPQPRGFRRAAASSRFVLPRAPTPPFPAEEEYPCK
eukprot:GHVU01231967.1.p3 GENE.GHVU01231967.1~~GHVU01231967.1.p3  ORF type:complete len:227 (+),score=41.62 GHVU01231967.1:547-1227(+)